VFNCNPEHIQVFNPVPVGVDRTRFRCWEIVYRGDMADPEYAQYHARTLRLWDGLQQVVSEDLSIYAQLARTKHVERITEALSGPQSGIVLVDDIAQGLRVVDAYAAEHLEIHTRDARDVALRVRNAGAIFVGTHAPVSLGDYCAGSNHVLPTGGSATHASGLSVQTFLRGIHIIDYDRAALEGVAGHVVALALAEDLPGHAAAITVRLPD
jgi:histidinol dehydrogenase